MPEAELSLRAVEERDLPELYRQQLDPEANRMAAFTRKELAEEAAFYAHWERIRSTATTETRIILSGEKVAGFVAKFYLGEEPQVSYWIGREFWGRGVATWALSTFMKELRERPLFARVAHDNAASKRVLEKCGFRVIGKDREFANARGAVIEEFVLKFP